MSSFRRKHGGSKGGECGRRNELKGNMTQGLIRKGQGHRTYLKAPNGGKRKKTVEQGVQLRRTTR